jgi:O-antigen/teichoic acid export membrane protein
LIKKFENLKKIDFGKSVKSAMKWSAAVYLLRDLLQFLAMLLMIRFLTPKDYGIATLAQSIVGFIAVFSFNSFLLHALQFRDPKKIDWDIHFAAGILINSALFIFTVILSLLLIYLDILAEAAFPLVVISSVFLLEIPASLHLKFLEANHLWARFRMNALLGTVIALIAGVIVAMRGGTYWAIAVQPPLFVLPAAIDFFITNKPNIKPNWSFEKYKDTLQFGLNRIISTLFLKLKQLIESVLLKNIHGYIQLGIFNRSIGICTLLVGRIGSLVGITLYPILTRYPPGSLALRILSRKLLIYVTWVSIPISFILGLESEKIILLIYGKNWTSVSALVPYATFFVLSVSLISLMNSFLLGNLQQKKLLHIDIFFSISSILIAFFIINDGLKKYLSYAILNNVAQLFIYNKLLTKTKALASEDFKDSLVPPIIASLITFIIIRYQVVLDTYYILFDIIIVSLIFILLYTLILFVFFHKLFMEAVNPVLLWLNLTNKK